MERPVHAVESRAVTLTRADASAVDAASQLCDSLASLDAVADVLFAGLRVRGDTQRGACALCFVRVAQLLMLSLCPAQVGWRRSGLGCNRRDSVWTL